MDSAAFRLPSGEEIKSELRTPADLDLVKQRITDVMQVLGDFRKRREENK